MRVCHNQLFNLKAKSLVKNSCVSLLAMNGKKHLLTEKVSWTYDEMMFDSLSQHRRFHFKKVSPHQVVRLPGGFVVGRLAVDDLLVGLLRTIWKSRVMEEL